MQQRQLLVNGVIHTGESILKEHSILIEGNKILKVFSSRENPINDKKADIIDLQGNYVVPGFVDLQLNGGGGVFFTQTTEEKTIDTIYEVYLESGTTSFLPTIISTTLDKILLSIEVTKDYMRKKPGIALGMHLEGPYFNPKKRGAHLEKYIHRPSDEEIEKIALQGEGVISLLTADPEALTERQINTLLEAGIKLSAGHTEIGYANAQKAFTQGFTKVTHLYNAMSQFLSREPGLVGAFFDRPEVWGGIIVDGIHCDYASVRIAHTLKQGKLFVVSDSSYVGHPDEKVFDFGFGPLRSENGKFYTDNGSLAGAAVTMLESLQNCVRRVGIPLEEAVKMVSTYPAMYLGLDHQIGKIKEGAYADLIVLNQQMEIDKIFSKGELSIDIIVK
jgi:N-acetylglucosamine-6-phosphate deacetylase